MEINPENPSSEHENDDSKRVEFRKQISTMSFEDLQKLKNKIGQKAYDKAVFGGPTKKPSNFKRANKNRPREMSSKKKINLKDTAGPTKPQTSRDPRFEPLCGSYDDKEFKSNYKFIKNIRKKERVQLQKEYEKEEDEHKKLKIKSVIQRMDNQIREQEKLEEKREKEFEEKRNIKSKLSKGEKPIFKQKSEKRLESLVSKYEELKKSNKLQKHLERRHKKLAQKERKKNFVPI